MIKRIRCLRGDILPRRKEGQDFTETIKKVKMTTWQIGNLERDFEIGEVIRQKAEKRVEEGLKIFNNKRTDLSTVEYQNLVIIELLTYLCSRIVK